LITCATAGLCNTVQKTCVACTTGQFQCSGSTLQSCDAANQVWTNAQTCATSGLCDPGAGTCDAPVC
jgi:hypothetical protein